MQAYAAEDVAKKSHVNKRSVAGRRNRARREEARALFRTCILMAVFLALFSGFIAYLRAQAAGFEYKKSKIKEQIELQRSLSEQQEVQIAILTSPERIKTLATAKLGMVEPSHLNYIVFDSSSDNNELHLASSQVVTTKNSLVETSR